MRGLRDVGHPVPSFFLSCTALCLSAGLSEAACLNSGFWDLFHSAMGEQGRQLAEQGVGMGRPFTTVVEGGRLLVAGGRWELFVGGRWELQK